MGLNPGDVLDGTYQVVRLIGEGGMGSVFEARHTRLPGRFAVKVMLREIAAHPEAFARFRREAEITSSLRHTNIVQVVDFNQLPDGSPYIVMEFLEGESLGQRLASGGLVALPRAVDIAEQVASALAAAHSRGVVHRDLKPDNILLLPVTGQEAEGKEAAKILDFGISKVRTVTTNLTQASAVMGTPSYMSPEQALGRGDDVDAATDQFALGSIAYEMLTGQVAFTGDSVPSILFKVVHEAPPAIGNALGRASAAIEAVIAKAMSKKKADRYPSVLDFARALREAAAHGTAPTLPVLPVRGSRAAPARTESGAGMPTTFGSTASELVNPEIAGRRRRRRRVGMAVGAGAALAVAAAVGVFALGGGNEPAGPVAASPSIPAVAGGGPASAEPAVVQPGAPMITPAPATPAAPAAPAAPAVIRPADHVQIDVSGAPAGVAVTVDGVMRGLPILLPRGSGIHDVRFEVAGYEPKELKVEADGDQTIPLVMRRAERRTAAHAAPAGMPAALPPPQPSSVVPKPKPAETWNDPFESVGAQPHTVPPKPTSGKKKGRPIDDL